MNDKQRIKQLEKEIKSLKSQSKSTFTPRNTHNRDVYGDLIEGTREYTDAMREQASYGPCTNGPDCRCYGCQAGSHGC